jgi:predicted AlkP superfamily phosphohydrolase/phosphomutase
MDGAVFAVLDALVAEGVMPNLAKVYAAGHRAVLRSSPTVITPQAWTCMTTGRSPGFHGIYDFVRPERRPEGIFWRVTDSRDNACETIWQYASRKGHQSTVLNFVCTAPPKPLRGHLVPGFVSSRHLRRSSFPVDLFDRIRQWCDAPLDRLGMDLETERQALQDMPPDQWQPWIMHHIEREQVWFEVMEQLMQHEPSELTAIVFDGVDKIQHLAYRYIDPGLIPRRPDPWEADIIALCRQYFHQLDGFLGRVIERVGPWGRVIVASDHGFTGSHEVVYINKWLSDRGYLRWRKELAADDKHGLFSQRLADLANAVDLPHTRAYALMPSSNGIYLNVSPDEYHSFREQLIGELLAIRGPDGGQVITQVKKREEWFPGPFKERAPDLTLSLRDHGLLSVLNADAVVVPRPSVVGTHHPHHGNRILFYGETEQDSLQDVG